MIAYHNDEALRELALKATPGPWTAEAIQDGDPDGSGEWMVSISPLGFSSGYGADGTDDANVKFIAAANPETILRLLDERELMREALEFYAGNLRENQKMPIVVAIDGGRTARSALERVAMKDKIK